MKTRKNKSNSTYSISGLTATEYSVLRSVLFSSRRCFPSNEDNYRMDEEYYSNDDFVCTLTGREIEALERLINEI